MKKISRGHIHRGIAYALVTLGGACLFMLVLYAHMETAATLETAKHLEASVLRSSH
jgi:hypothetical protein